MRFKGRHWLMLWLLVFLCTTAAIVARQTAALRTARRVHDLREQRSTLESRRADLERRIRQASGREVLQAKAERDLGLHLPADNEFVLFRVPGATPERAR